MSDAAHSVFTRDGTPPAELLRIGREQLQPYEVLFREKRVTDASRAAGGFRLTFESGETVVTRKVLLATGVRDLLPDKEGFREFWSRGVFQCPYCHGWEVAGQPLAIYGRGEAGAELAKLLLGWSRDSILFTDGPAALTREQRSRLAQKEIVVREETVVRLVGSAKGLEAVVLENGKAVPRSALFLHPPQEPRSDLAQRLGCQLSAQGRVKANENGQTSVPGVYVAGDAGPNFQQIITAAASGAIAAIFLNYELCTEDFDA